MGRRINYLSTFNSKILGFKNVIFNRDIEGVGRRPMWAMVALTRSNKEAIY